MSDFVTIQIDDSQLKAALERLESSALDLSPAMRSIAGTLAYETDQNFQDEGRPRWKPLARATIEGRVDGIAKGKKGGYRKDGRISKTVANQAAGGFRILQYSGRLASSIASDHDATSAVVGSGLPYARIHQFGGMAGVGRKVEIDARPFLPLTSAGALTPEASESVLSTVMRHLKKAAGV